MTSEGIVVAIMIAVTVAILVIVWAMLRRLK